jgi:hypothetical protein
MKSVLTAEGTGTENVSEEAKEDDGSEVVEG